MRIVFLVFPILLLATSSFAAAPQKITSSGPIEINADTLEVFQEENRAVFTGHVVAVQGKVKLKSDKMNVFYRKPEDKKGEDKEAIQKIEVEGNVFLSTPEETAKGMGGIYDVEHNEIRLNDKVVLTRGNNVLKGDKLVYNFQTGKSVISSAAQAKSGGKKERVRALFVPDKKEDGKKP